MDGKVRTIKFRGKASHNGEWLYGDLINIHGEYHILGEDDMREDGHHVRQDSDRPTWVEPGTIGEFTGLRDKNGKEIYEGDILLWTRKNVHIEGRPRQDFSDKCIVYYDNGKRAFQFRYELRCGACVGYLDFDDDRADESYVEVIGNVFDDPGLIEKGGQDETVN